MDTGFFSEHSQDSEEEGPGANTRKDTSRSFFAASDESSSDNEAGGESRALLQRSGEAPAAARSFIATSDGESDSDDGGEARGLLEPSGESIDGTPMEVVHPSRSATGVPLPAASRATEAPCMKAEMAAAEDTAEASRVKAEAAVAAEFWAAEAARTKAEAAAAEAAAEASRVKAEAAVTVGAARVAEAGGTVRRLTEPTSTLVRPRHAMPPPPPPSPIRILGLWLIMFPW
jgi:hypothetical protein